MGISFLLRLSFAAAVLGLAGPGAASAQSSSVPSQAGEPLSPPLSYDVKTMSFERWCQETQQYPSERCDARRPADVKAFQDYRDAVERYELEYLQQVQKDEEAKSRVNRDPTQTVRSKQDALP